ncbi:MAG: hypothetical protein ACRENO_09530 [Thermodesulfobacteriota bacterium]
MKKIMSFLLIFSFFSLNSKASEYFPMTPSQKHFTAIVQGLPGVVSAEWKTPVSLWVKVNNKAIGSDGNTEKAATLADILAERGRTAMFQPYCVHIYQTPDKVLGRDCVY